MASTPCSSIENSRSVYSSPKTPIKKSFSKIRSKAKDTICLVFAISLIGERCMFNIEQHSGLRQKLESVLEHDIDFKASSSRICRPCGRKVKALEKKLHVVMEQVQELRGKFMSACRKNFTHTVKRMSKASPSPKAYKKSRQGGLFVSTSKDNCEEDLAESFQLLPDDDSMECCESSQLTSTVLSGGNEKKSPTEKKRVRVSDPCIKVHFSPTNE